MGSPPCFQVHLLLEKALRSQALPQLKPTGRAHRTALGESRSALNIRTMDLDPSLAFMTLCTPPFGLLLLLQHNGPAWPAERHGLRTTDRGRLQTRARTGMLLTVLRSEWSPSPLSQAKQVTLFNPPPNVKIK